MGVGWFRTGDLESIIAVQGTDADEVQRVASALIEKASTARVQGMDLSVGVTPIEPLAKLREVIADRFSEDELRTLCFDIGLEYEDLGGYGKEGKVRELLSYYKRREAIPALIATGRRLRPDVPWDALVENRKTSHEVGASPVEQLEAVRQRDDEACVAIFDEWVARADLDNWEGWTSGPLAAGQPELSVEQDKKLVDLMSWLLSRMWPQRYPQVEAAFQNFRRVLQDFYVTFHKYAREEYGCGILRTEKIYRRGYGNPELEDHLTREYDFHIRLVKDLILELTRAANYVCDQVRQYLIPSFRLKEGILLVVFGPYESGWLQHRPEYRDEERISQPYPGLDRFKQTRTTRDVCFAKGEEADDPQASIRPQ